MVRRRTCPLLEGLSDLDVEKPHTGYSKKKRRCAKCRPMW